MEFNVADLFEAAVDRVPDREVLVCGEQRRTFRELEERANRVAHVLKSLGIGKGHHVGIYAWNCAEWIEAMLGAYKVRAIPINVNYRYVEEELRYLFDNADLVAVVFERQFAPRIAAVAPELPRLRHFICFGDADTAARAACEQLGAIDYEEALRSASPERDFEARSGDDIYVIYTGGTTGMPKGVVWRQEDVVFALGGGIDPYTKEKARRPEDITAKIRPDGYLTHCGLAPLMHGAAQWSFLGQAVIGNRVVLLPGRFEPHKSWEIISREKVNAITIPGDAVGRPLADALDEREYDLSSLIVISSTAAVFSPAVKRKFLEKLPNVILLDAHGSSEQGMTGMAQVTRESLSQPGPAGGALRISPNPDVTVLDENLRPVQPGSGVIGKIARSGNIPLGYYKDPEKTAATFVTVDGRRWAIPGDYGTVEADGSIVMLGRGSSCINSGGEKIYPEEVEGVLKSHPAVYDALVVGVPDERWGQRVAAVVAPRDGQEITLADLERHCRKLIAGYKVPRELHLVDAIRRSPSGKPDYEWARKVALAGRHRAD